MTRLSAIDLRPSQCIICTHDIRMYYAFPHAVRICAARINTMVILSSYALIAMHHLRT